MNKEQKKQLIEEIVGILHVDASSIYDGEDNEYRVVLYEDYFEDVAEGVFNLTKNKFSQYNKKNKSELKIKGFVKSDKNGINLKTNTKEQFFISYELIEELNNFIKTNRGTAEPNI